MSWQIYDEGDWNELSGRLHTYIRKMRELRNGAPELDSRNFFKSVSAIETQMSHLKVTYEKEISKLRQQLDETNSHRSRLELKNSKLEANASECQARVVEESERTRHLNEEIKTLQVSFQKREQEFQHSLQQAKVVQTGASVNETNRKLDQTLRENLDLRSRYDCELLMRRENEEKVKQLQDQITFDGEVSRQQESDLQIRLSAATVAIKEMEAKMQSGQGQPVQEVNIDEMIANIRAAAEKQLKIYKLEAEEMFTKSITLLKSQMEADKTSFEAISEENQRLLTVVAELNTKIINLQAELVNNESMRRSAEENIVATRERASSRIQSMAGKLKEQQDLLFEKIKELNEVKTKQIPLKAEVESLKALIEEEEKRLLIETKHSKSSQSLTASIASLQPRQGAAQSYSATYRPSAAAAGSNVMPTCPIHGNRYHQQTYTTSVLPQISGGAGYHFNAKTSTAQMSQATKYESSSTKSTSKSGGQIRTTNQIKL